MAHFKMLNNYAKMDKSLEVICLFNILYNI